MEKREPRVYYLAKREGRKALLVFDAGHMYGDIHIYEHVEKHSSEDIIEEMKSEYQSLPQEFKKEIVRYWVEKNFGHSISWKLESS